ncbi:hypothetical protein [Spirilliplanes yamanashiensis]|uniref:Lipoprotein n=1 Tax=Spirilliplanes yamanashiensis TaxID=42233 RepID=A0A8J3Y3R8_9ACTN|nr:hypothetical protein [Spirilliplanes yamanashiensis]MDP9814110.1 hypothetical protein [Spirilliplanes yamanashiensis]GIJ00909.1 hypothetical protein Sya03_02610 [Spirilliplanes yamanashiensis]
MRTTTRGTIAALALATGLALAGCNNAGTAGAGADAGAGPGATTAPAVPADPKAALAASTAELKKGDYTFTVAAVDQNATGNAHMASTSASLVSESTDPEAKGTFEFRVVGTDHFMKIKMDLGDAGQDLGDLGELGDSPEMKKLADTLKQMQEMFSGKYWSKLDTAKVTSKMATRFDAANPDITGSAALLDGVVTAEKQADGSYAGTLDATRSGPGQQLWTSKELTQHAEKLKAVPFVATLDAQGRLASLTIDVPGVGSNTAGEYKTTITGYGTGKPVEAPPAAETREATAQTYEMLNR